MCRDDADVSVVAALLRVGCDPNTPTIIGGTAVLHCAASGNAAVLRQLLAAGGSANAANAVGLTPLHAVVRSELGDTHDRLCVLLESPHVDVAVPYEGMTAEAWARAHQLVDFAEAIRGRVR